LDVPLSALIRLNPTGWLIDAWVPTSFQAYFVFKQGNKKGQWTFTTPNEARPENAFQKAMDAFTKANGGAIDCLKGNNTISY
jgi:hypothetical protein